MEERLALEWGAFHHSLPTWKQLVDDSILRKAPSPLHLDTEAAYQITHVILFLFGFGIRRGPVQIPDRARTRGLLIALIVTFCGERHWDLVGELLLCWDCLQLESGEIYEKAWDVFMAQQADDGSFAGPQSPPESNGGDRERGKTLKNRRRFLERYHTTLVAILAGNCYLRRLPHRSSRAAPTRRASRVPGDVDSGVASSVEKDAEWLSRLLDRLSEERAPHPKAACGILVGIWICTALNSGLLAELSHIAGRVAERLSTVKQWADLPPALSILAYALLSRFGIAPPGLATFVRRLARVLDANSANDPVLDLAFCEKRILLNQIGLVKSPVLLPFTDSVQAARAMPLDAPKAAVETLLLYLSSCTGYGTRLVRVSANKAWVGELLSGLSVRFFRSSDILTACNLARNISYLGFSADSSRADLIDFVLLQRRPEGGYGFFGAADRSLSTASGGAFMADSDLYLPITLSCLWTLAEATGGWRLYRSVRL
jgi:hypothetical protein